MASSRFVPRLALRDPRWLFALVILGVNDHVLKSSEWAGIVTGKLSDFAGLVVAPIVLAALFQLRTRRSLVAVLGVTGGVFAAIQLWPWATHAWTTLLATIGVHWLITPDPTDLIALPALIVAWRIISDPRPIRLTRPHALRLVERAALAGGLLLSAATSEPDDGSSSTGESGLMGETGEETGFETATAMLEPVVVGAGESPSYIVTMCSDPTADRVTYEFSAIATLTDPSSGGPPEIFVRVQEPDGNVLTLTDGPNVDATPRMFTHDSSDAPTDHASDAVCDPGFVLTFERIDGEDTGSVSVGLDVSASFTWEDPAGGEATVTITEEP